MADKYRFYVDEVRRLKAEKGIKADAVVYLTAKNVEKTVEGQVMDKMKLDQPCCRRHFLTHVDIE